MSGETAAMVRTFRVGKRKVTLTISNPKNVATLHMAAEWEPDVPRRLSKREWKQYREGRDKVFAELCEQTGLRGMMVEV
jgi:hypothetical protein